MNHSPSITQFTVDFSSLLSIMRKDERGEGLTSKEIAKQIGRSREKTREIIAEAQEMGLVRLTQRKQRRIDGIVVTVPAYVMEVRQ